MLVTTEINIWHKKTYAYEMPSISPLNFSGGFILNNGMRPK